MCPTERSVASAGTNDGLLREENILEIMGNQEESQRERGLNPKDQEIVGTVVNQGIRRKVFGLERTMKEIK